MDDKFIIVDKLEQLAQLPIELRLVQVPSIRNVLEAVARHSLSSCVLLSLCFPSEAVVWQALAEAGPTITLTTVTDIAASILGSTIDLPGVADFCEATACCIFFVVGKPALQSPEADVTESAVRRFIRERYVSSLVHGGPHLAFPSLI